MAKKQSWFTEGYKEQLAQFMAEINEKPTLEEWARIFTKLKENRSNQAVNVKHEILGEMDFDTVEKEEGWKYFKMPDPVVEVE